jgi:hypothetical protein
MDETKTIARTDVENVFTRMRATIDELEASLFQDSADERADTAEDESGEEARSIQDYDNYSVSNLGYVYNGDTGNVLKPWVTNGYLQVGLCKGGVRKNKYIHRLVARAFVPNPDKLPEVDHISRDKTDNRVTNLRWTDRSNNNRNRSIRGARFTRKLRAPFVKIERYGPDKKFDRLCYSGHDETFYVFIDDHVGYREIVPTKINDYMYVQCVDASGKKNRVNLAKLRDYAADLLADDDDTG